MAKKIIKLSSLEDLKIFMSPQRQKLLRNMHILGKAVTPKAVADMLGISPSSAQFHIKKLESLGVVELDHKESINGIQAKFYKITDADVQIGSSAGEDLSKERYAIMQNIIKNSFDGLIRLYESEIPYEEKANYGDFLNGVVHLTEQDSKQLFKMIKEFIEVHEIKHEKTDSWEYTLMIYKTEIKNAAR